VVSLKALIASIANIVKPKIANTTSKLIAKTNQMKINKAAFMRNSKAARRICAIAISTSTNAVMKSRNALIIASAKSAHHSPASLGIDPDVESVYGLLISIILRTSGWRFIIPGWNPSNFVLA